MTLIPKKSSLIGMSNFLNIISHFLITLHPQPYLPSDPPHTAHTWQASAHTFHPIPPIQPPILSPHLPLSPIPPLHLQPTPSPSPHLHLSPIQHPIIHLHPTLIHHFPLFFTAPLIPSLQPRVIQTNLPHHLHFPHHNPLHFHFLLHLLESPFALNKLLFGSPIMCSIMSSCLDPHRHPPCCQIKVKVLVIPSVILFLIIDTHLPISLLLQMSVVVWNLLLIQRQLQMSIGNKP